MTLPLQSLTDAARDLARDTARSAVAGPHRTTRSASSPHAFNAMADDLRQAQRRSRRRRQARVGRRDRRRPRARDPHAARHHARLGADARSLASAATRARTGELVDMIVGEVDRLERVVAGADRARPPARARDRGDAARARSCSARSSSSTAQAALAGRRRSTRALRAARASRSATRSRSTRSP